MKLVLRSALAAALMAGSATAMIPSAANAGVVVGIGLPAVVVAPEGPGYVAYDDQYYYDPIYISGSWYHGPYRWRMHNGEREFFLNGHWRQNEWRGGARPNVIMFRNGGAFRDGRYDGFDGAERINARFRPNSDARQDRRELNGDRADMKDDRGDMRQDRRDLHEDKRDADHDGDHGNH